MSFYLPNFNLAVNDWYASESPVDAPTIYLANHSVGRRISSLGGITPDDFYYTLLSWLLTPSTNEIGTLLTNPSDPDVLEVPAGSGRYYIAVDGSYVGEGFANEHLAITLAPLTDGLKTYLAGYGVIFGAWPDYPAYLGG